MHSGGQTLAQSPHWVQTLTLYTPGAGKCGSMISAAFLGLFSLKRFKEHATRQALQPEHLELSTYSRIMNSFLVSMNSYKNFT
jgi:hypothetical protein